MYRIKYTPKPGSLIEALNKKDLKTHFEQIGYSLLTLLIFLPFYVSLSYTLNAERLKAEKYVPHYQTSYLVC
jgi:hypothetical protein